MSDYDKIKELIETALPGSKVVIHDPRNDGIHLEAIVVAEQFNGLSLIKQHKLVMKPLQEAFETTLHALGLKTYSPQQWENERKEEENG